MVPPVEPQILDFFGRPIVIEPSGADGPAAPDRSSDATSTSPSGSPAFTAVKHSSPSRSETGIAWSDLCGGIPGARSSCGVLHRGGVAPPERLVCHATQGRLFQPRCRGAGDLAARRTGTTP